MEEWMTLVKEMKWKTKLLIILACIAGLLATFVFQVDPTGVLGFIGLFVLGFILGPYVPRRGGGGGADVGGGDGGGG